MQCPKCQHENPSDNAFCGSCGTRLSRVCPACDKENPADHRFCGGCGVPLAEAAAQQPEAEQLATEAGRPQAIPSRRPEDYTPRHLADKILTARSTVEGERKQVTVLFADVKGSMELAEQVEPERWHSILDRFFQILADGVHRFEGTVNQYTGDGIMALFGAPIAHEDHAQRACYAALHLREELRKYSDELRVGEGLNFSVRMGLNSGDVIVGRIGDDLRMDYTAQGHTVGLAARMEQIAAADSVYLAEHTAKLCSGYFDFRDLGPTSVKGAAGPVHVFELAGASSLRTRFDVSRSRGLTRFVGRDDDMQSLENALERALAGNGQVVGVVADAGTGKSRLCFEFAERCRARGILVLEGKAVPHGKNIPFLPILQVVRFYYGITEADDDRAAREKIAGRLLLMGEEFRAVLPILFEFMGVADPERPAPDMDPEAKQRQLVGLLRRLVQDDSEGQFVVLIEDLHWADVGTENYLTHWADAVAGSPSMLIVNFRPEYRAGWMQKSYYRQIALTPLGPDATGELVDDLLGRDPSLEGLADKIHRHTLGNPFFVEEVIQNLIESRQLEGVRGRYRLVGAVEELAVPDSVQSLLAARIDRLVERDKRVLQTAAVIGKEFVQPILEAVADFPHLDVVEALDALKAAEFVYEQSLYPQVEYAFKHPLTQEVALGSQLQERRREAHASVARALENAHRESIEEHAALLAHHWEQAGDVVEAAHWYDVAADWAATNDLAAALDHAHRVRDLLGNAPESKRAAALALEARNKLFRFGWRFGLSVEETRCLHEEGLALAEMAEDAEAVARLALLDAISAGNGVMSGEFVERTQAAVQLADQVDNQELRTVSYCFLSYANYCRGNLRESAAAAARAEESARGIEDLRNSLLTAPFRWWLVLFPAGFRMRLGNLDRAEADIERAATYARGAGNMEFLGWAHSWSVLLEELRGNSEAALHYASRELELAETVGTRFNEALAYADVASAKLLTGEFRGAADAAQVAARMIRESNVMEIGEGGNLVSLSCALVSLGDTEGGRHAAEEAVAVTHRTNTWCDAIDAYLALARAVVATEGRSGEAKAAEAVAKAADLVEQTESRAQLPSVHLARAELERLRGDRASERAELSEAHRLYVEINATGHAERIARQLDR